MSYASGTSVPVERSQAELERLLSQHGATQFYRGHDDDEARAIIGFRLDERIIKFELPLPRPEDFPRGGRERAARAQRERWRALLLSVKAKLVGVEAGIESVEQAFLAHVVAADGKTVHQHVGPRLAEAYKTGQSRPLLPALGEAGR